MERNDQSTTLGNAWACTPCREHPHFIADADRVIGRTRAGGAVGLRSSVPENDTTPPYTCILAIPHCSVLVACLAGQHVPEILAGGSNNATGVGSAWLHWGLDSLRRDGTVSPSSRYLRHSPAAVSNMNALALLERETGSDSSSNVGSTDTFAPTYAKLGVVRHGARLAA